MFVSYDRRFALFEGQLHRLTYNYVKDQYVLGEAVEEPTMREQIQLASLRTGKGEEESVWLSVKVKSEPIVTQDIKEIS